MLDFVAGQAGNIVQIKLLHSSSDLFDGYQRLHAYIQIGRNFLGAVALGDHWSISLSRAVRIPTVGDREEAGLVTASQSNCATSGPK